MALNVNRNVDDLFYRYKMPRVVAKVEGKGNGIKTVIANMVDVAKALGRPPTYPTKYFGCELGAQTQFDLKNDRYIVNGDHDAQKLQELLDGFIKKFVLCQNCENPETTLTCRKNQIMQKCKACGHRGQLNTRHRLAAFILKNPPPEDMGGAQVKQGKSSPTEEESEEIGAGGGGDSPENISNGGENTPPVDDDDDWQPDSTADSQHSEVVTGAMAALTMNPDLDKPEDDRLDIFLEYIEKIKKSGTTPDGTAILLEANRLDIKIKAALLVARVFLDQPAKFSQQVEANKNLFLKFCQGDEKAQRYFLGGVEQLIVSNMKELLSKTPSFFHKLYDLDIVEEDVFLEWAAKQGKRHIKREKYDKLIEAASTFIKWLKEAEEESSGDEEDDEAEIEVQFEKAPGGPEETVPTVVESKPETNGKQEEDGDDDDEDLDIDDI